MAGDWIKWVKGLAKRPEVIDMSVALNRSRHEIASLCMEVWEWADENVDPEDTSASCPGFVRLRSASSNTIDGFIGVSGLADAMISVGWLEVRNGRIVFPKFGRHNGKHAKGRALDAERKRAERRSKKEDVPDLSGSDPDKNRTRVEERRVSNKQTGDASEFDDSGQVGADFHKKVAQFLKDWNATPGARKCSEIPTDVPCYQELGARINEANWFRRYPQALAKFPLRGLVDGMQISKFLEPDTLNKVLANEWDYTPRGASRSAPKPKTPDMADLV